MTQARAKPEKPLGIKAYGSIPHLPGSKLGVGEHTVHAGQARICTERPRDRHDRIIVEEKLDGACVAVARVDGIIVPLGRAGYELTTARFDFLRRFHGYAMERQQAFLELLEDGERAIGEWLILAHGTRYDLPHEPWVLFDVMRGEKRLTREELRARSPRFPMPHLLSEAPMTTADADAALGEHGHHGAIDRAEGAIWRVERRGKVDFLAKWVRPAHETGRYLSSVSGAAEVYNTYRAADPPVR